jgi:hypothetical protein
MSRSRQHRLPVSLIVKMHKILYNTMMSRLTITTALSLLCSAIMPITAHAYLTPDEVLNDGDFSVRFYEPPPSKREIEEVAREQQERSAERREAEQAALEKEGETEAETDDGLHEAAPEEEDSDLEALIKALEEWQASQNEGGGSEEEGTDSTVNAEEQRLLERIRDREDDERAAAYQAWVNGQQGELHGGAPLSETGPKTVIAVLITALAVGETWRRVKKMDRI